MLECLDTGLPVFGFDLGAQGEALAGHPIGHLLPLDLDPNWLMAVLSAQAHSAMHDAILQKQAV